MTTPIPLRLARLSGYRMRSPWLSLKMQDGPLVAILAILLWIATSASVLAGPCGLTGPVQTCGGTVACQCGNCVVADYTMTADLGPCPGYGLFLESGVHLNCQGFQVIGPNDGTEQYGINLREITAATVEGCEVSGFMRGIRLRDADGNTILNNVIHDNGDSAKRVGHGIDLARGPKNNVFRSNQIYNNGDEGIHVGTGSENNRFIDNVVFDNSREQIYVLASQGNTFIGNTTRGVGSNSLYLIDSSFTYLEGNTFSDRTAVVSGDSHDNEFVDNSFVNAPLHFRVFEASPNRIPTDNSVSGGYMSNADRTESCLRFTRTRGNTITDVDLTKCKVQVLSEGSGSEPSVNTFLGVPLNPSKMSVDANSTLSVGWRLKARVQEIGGAPVGEARVQIQDIEGNLVADLLTDNNGDIPQQILFEYVRTGSTTRAQTPHTLTATKTGYVPYNRALQVTTDLQVPIALCPLGRGGSFVDGFDRPDSTTLGNAWEEVQGDLVISGGELQSAALVANHLAIVPGLSCPTQNVAADFASVGNDGGPRLGVILRFQDPRNYYFVYRRVGGSSYLRISKVVDGVEKTLKTVSIRNPRVNTFFRIGGRAVGTTLTLELDGVAQFSVSDPTFSTGPVGILLGTNSTKPSRADNFDARVQ